MLLGNLKAGLGFGASYKAIVTSSAFVLLCYFYVYSIASFLKFPIVIFQNGYSYNAIFENTYLIDKNWDTLFIITLTVAWLLLAIRNKKFGIATSLIYTALAMTTGLSGFSLFYYLTVFMSLPFILSLLIFDKIVKENMVLEIDTNLLLINYFSIIIIISSLIGIFLSSSFLLFSIQPSSIPIHNYTYPPYVLFSNLTPVLVLLLMFSFFINISMKKFNLHKILSKFKGSSLSVPSTAGYTQLSTKAKFFYLLMIIILSITLFLIPHNPAVNETKQLIGVDTDEYIEWESILINSFNSGNFSNQGFVNLAMGDRPMTLFFLLLLIQFTTMDDPSVIEYFPMVLIPLFVLTVFFLTKELFSNDTAALFSAFLSGASFHLLVGMYAGLYANWLALIVGYVAITLFFKYLKGSAQRFGIFFFISMIVLLFTHVYTWAIISVVLVILIVYSLKVGNNSRKQLFFLLSAIAVSLVLDIIRIYFAGTSSGGTQQMINIFNYGLSLDDYYQRWENLSFSTQIYVGGIFSNFIIYILVIYWALRSNIKEPRNVFFFIFFSLGLIPIFIGDEVLKARLFYDIPFQIPAAIALTQMMKTYNGKMIAFSLCMWILFICVRTLFHLYVVSPK
ncbi:hypothetical protein [Candidatus Nitrosocosmicus arcticus]|uniref:Glycosyltransferase RgtA/B/C/D-like domain-containing protein n=1 Tax=Candidatus Nitrosocosmicus arcticus TaxID=2035267 RepID=A0A557SYL5_9ARCH|nr:hypothetical protein [Candidatus Nitrosocosmicus arcticus]TVP41683.1 conserved membrane protein of unknown function [Candidatus Nitrosocosmicus arcticus]